MRRDGTLGRWISRVVGKGPPPRLPKRTAFVMLDYCGGRPTDRLFDRISRWNPGVPLMLLDNGSPEDRPHRATHRNAANSYVGGGIRDSIRLAESVGAEYLLFSVSDLRFAGKLVVADFEAIMDADDAVVMVSCSLTPDSAQAIDFPWMRQRPTGGVRRVRQADIICCLIRLSFIKSFGGFPESKGGWGYCEEIAYHAKRQDKTILVTDRCAIRHVRVRARVTTPDGEVLEKGAERRAVYDARYGSFNLIRSALLHASCDEEENVAVDRKPRPLELARVRLREALFAARSSRYGRKARKTWRSVRRRLGLPPASSRAPA